MAQVKVQTSAPLAGPGLSPGVPPTAMASPGSLGLQPSVNGTGPAPTPACPAPAVGYGDAPVSATSPGPPQENMANPKEKTPMCLVNELARFNRIQPQYKLLNERGPAHAKIFTVQLTLGEQLWEAEGTSIKKAQHSTASKALDESVLPRPAPRSPKVDINSNPGSITPTVELNGLAMKRGEPAIYRPLDPKPMPNYRANYNFRGMINQRYIKAALPPTLDPHKYTYRTNWLTEDTISTALHPVLLHLERQGTCARLLFVDCSSAFNTIIPSRLFIKMSDLGLQHIICLWIQDFLTNRPQEKAG